MDASHLTSGEDQISTTVVRTPYGRGTSRVHDHSIHTCKKKLKKKKFIIIVTIKKYII